MTVAPVPDCPFCRANNLLQGQPIAETADAYLLENRQFPGNYLIIPEGHAESPAELPDDWWVSVKTLLPQIPDLDDYNLSFNIGKSAGQTVKHLHLWVIPRTADHLSSGKGMIALIRSTQTLASPKN